jgi:hypothetical protein
MATSTLNEIRARVQEELKLGLLIEAAFFDAAAAGSITSSRYLRDTNKPPNFWSSQNTVIFRPQAATAANADDIRFAGALTPSSGLLAHTGANYTDTTVTSETLELWTWGVDPRIHFLDALNRAMKKVFLPRLFAVGHLGALDGDMAKTTDTDWTDVLTPTTSAKSVLARRTPFGLRSYNLIGNAAGEGTQSATIPVTKDQQVNAWAIASANVGTASFGGYDVINSAVFDEDAITHSEEEPQFMWWTGRSPATCTEMAVQGLGTVSSSADIFWNAMQIYKLDNLICPLPAVITENYQVPELFWAMPTSSTSSGVWNAGGTEWVQMKEVRDYTLVTMPSDANPNYIRFTSAAAYNYPIFARAMVPASALTTFALTESDTTTAPLNHLIPHVKIELLDSYLLPKNRAYWAPFRARAEAEWRDASISRIQKPVASTPQWRGPVTIRV